MVGTVIKRFVLIVRIRLKNIKIHTKKESLRVMEYVWKQLVSHCHASN